MEKHIFLVGGGPPFTPKMAKSFVGLLGFNKPRVAILCLDREGWQDYMPIYMEAFKQYKKVAFDFIPLPTTPISEALVTLQLSSGIIIGGGDTSLYADYIVETPIADVIKEKYEASTPIIGFSAGALISPTDCFISARDNVLKLPVYRDGLGLLKDVVIAVHYSEWDEEEHLKEIIERFPKHKHYGIDEQTCLYFRNEQLVDMEGRGVFTAEDGELVNINRSFV
ncbi:Type 1 glutamine amidotransferase-like domain-containing protein [Alkalihalobacillus pseudalcaliphilus]|uniref:Type 1 glutamine amidotransferase-like domain-containing protein n=1 Tax=Alkalihalobacillus pseudalcaliphilus TaxID=79884 RepID=UPI00064DB9DC|nr:Type 1 glutamine amidotransferase-like domain-containing protein [Alkalihalobacillus pseudalcaliphilus]KMK75895.1 peptidase S51 dipeptidase E [Alkalihalobacillus pseudalcaliphilus]